MSTRSKSGSRRLSILFGALTMVIAGLAWLWSSRQEVVVIPLGTQRIPLETRALACQSLMIAGAATCLLPPQWGLAIATLSAAGIAVIGIGQSGLSEATVEVFRSFRRVHVGPDRWFDEHVVDHPLFGSAGIPNNVAEVHDPDFHVTMHYDSDGWRVMPQTTRLFGRPPEIWFVGCSFTFGFGVDDDQSFPAVLARDAWRGYQLRNFSCPGWGTANVARVLEEKLRRPPLPAVVFYGWISHHQVRSYLRRSWRDPKRGAPRFPHYEVDSGGLRFEGIAEPSIATLPDEPETDKKEAALSIALIRDMHRRCADLQIPFFVLAFEVNDPVMQALLAENAIPIIDLFHGVFLDRFPSDGHPTRNWHQEVAHRLAADPRIASIAGRPDLYRPEAIPAAPRRWALVTDSTHGHLARFTPSEDDVFSWKVDRVTSVGDDPWRVFVTRAGLTLAQGEKVVVRFRGRSEVPGRPLLVTCASEAPPNQGLGLWQRFELQTEWIDFEASFTASRSASDAALFFALGGNNGGIEMADIHLQAHGDDLLAPKSRLAAPDLGK